MSRATAPVAPGRVLRSPGGGLSLRVERRPFLVGCVLVLLLLALGVVGVGTGEFPIAPGEVVATLLGGGDASSQFIVETLRLPRVLTALLAGGALGIAGAIFQSLTRNPLGSPEIVGFTWGSAAGAVVVITLIGTTDQASVGAGAVLGGVLSALLVLAVAYQNGIQGYRLVLVGIGVSLLLRAVTEYLLTRARFEDARTAAVWITGSLNGRGWEQVHMLLIAFVVLVPGALALGRTLRVLEMGDDAARALGARVERGRVALVLVGVALTAVATAAVGPVAFVALAAPQIARRLTRASGPGLIPAMLMGALLLEASDCAAQRIWPAQQLPVGIVTGAVGGVYLAWLLANEWRRRSG